MSSIVVIHFFMLNKLDDMYVSLLSSTENGRVRARVSSQMVIKVDKVFENFMNPRKTDFQD